MADTASERARNETRSGTERGHENARSEAERGHRNARSEAERAGAWIAIGPVAVLASWVALVFVPAAFRMQVLYASIALLSVAAFATAFYLASHPELLRTRPARSAATRTSSPAPPRSVAPSSADSAGRVEARAADMADDSDARFRLVVEAAPNAMIMIDAGGAIQLLNSQAERLFGYQRSDLLGQSIEVLLPQSLRALHSAVRGAYMRTPQTRRMGAGRDLFGLRRDGVEVPIEIGLNPIATRAGNFVLASIIDITERKRTEQALRASEERFRLLVEDAPNAMIMVDQAGKIVLLNAEAERLFGYERVELVGKPIETLVPDGFAQHPHLRDGHGDSSRVRPTGAGGDVRGLRRNGTEVPIEIGLNPIRTAEGAFVLASIVDISERKRAQEQFGAALME
jgi:PAS domain S-box-containing protein